MIKYFRKHWSWKTSREKEAGRFCCCCVITRELLGAFQKWMEVWISSSDSLASHTRRSPKMSVPWIFCFHFSQLFFFFTLSPKPKVHPLTAQSQPSTQDMDYRGTREQRQGAPALEWQLLSYPDHSPDSRTAEVEWQCPEAAGSCRLLPTVFSPFHLPQLASLAGAGVKFTPKRQETRQGHQENKRRQ